MPKIVVNLITFTRFADGYSYRLNHNSSNLLNELQIWGWETSITDLSPLAFLTKLTKLNLSSGLISDLSPLQGLTELTYIRCCDAKITDISPLASLKKLTYLNLVNNQITDISPLRSLTNLRELHSASW